MYLVNARGKTGSLSVAVRTAKDALTTSRDLESEKFTAVVLDDRGRQWSLEELEAAAAAEAQSVGENGS